VKLGADEVLAATAHRVSAAAKDADRAVEWLKDFLRARPRRSERCVAEGNKALGLTKDLKWWRVSVLRGKALGRPRKTGFGDGQCWWFTRSTHVWPFPGLEEGEEREEGEEGTRSDNCLYGDSSERDTKKAKETATT
jgi:hypothetical protein